MTNIRARCQRRARRKGVVDSARKSPARQIERTVRDADQLDETLPDGLAAV